MKAVFWTTLAVLVGVAGAALGDPGNQRILSREELEAGIAPHVPAIRNCYKQHTDPERANGELQLELLIQPKGKVQEIWVFARAADLDKLRECIGTLSTQWIFPEKSGFTNAVMPFQFDTKEDIGIAPLNNQKVGNNP